jgi:hypothetical protein
MGYPCYEPPCNCGDRNCSDCGEYVREQEMEEAEAMEEFLMLMPETVFIGEGA